MWRPGNGTVGEAIDCSGALYERLIEPMLLATLNNEPPEASARLAATLMRETLAAGGRTCRPLIAQEGLSSAFVDPALAYLTAHGATVQFGHELHRIDFKDGRADSLDFGGETDRARSEGRRRSRRAAQCRRPPAAGPANAERIPRHRQCAFPRRRGRHAAAP